MLKRLNRFFQVDLWRLQPDQLRRSQAFFIALPRLASRTLDSVRRCAIGQRASGLAFYSLLAVVPVLALVFGLSKGFDLDQTLERQLLARVEGQQQAVQWIIEFAHSLLQETRGGLIAGVGVVVLFWTMIQVLSNVEWAFNEIWGVEQGRAWARKITDYLALVLLCPFLVAASSAVTVLITTQVTLVVNQLDLLKVVSPAISFALKLLPYGFIWILLTGLYLFMPNTRVRFGSALVAGLVAGTGYQLVQKMHIFFQIGVAKYNAIYGSFAALPLFLIWLQLSWLIVLIGAAIAHAHQYRDSLGPVLNDTWSSAAAHRLISLGAARVLVKRFSTGAGPTTAAEVAAAMSIPHPLAARTLEDLSRAGIAAKLERQADAGAEQGFQPARDPACLTISLVLDALEGGDPRHALSALNGDFDQLADALATFSKLREVSAANHLLQDL